MLDAAADVAGADEELLDVELQLVADAAEDSGEVVGLEGVVLLQALEIDEDVVVAAVEVEGGVNGGGMNERGEGRVEGKIDVLALVRVGESTRVGRRRRRCCCWKAAGRKGRGRSCGCDGGR